MKVLLAVIGALSVAGFTQSPAAPKLESALAIPLTAKLTTPNGASRTIVLDGVGCSVSMCSRTVIKGKSEDGSLEGTPLNSIAAITNGTEDHALLLLKDGTERRVSLVQDFRVLYFTHPNGGTGKVDLTKIKSIEFLPTADGR